MAKAPDGNIDASTATRASTPTSNHPGIQEEQLDAMLKILLAAKGKPDKFKVVLPKYEQTAALCHSANRIFLQQDTILELEAPMDIVGDIHGQYSDLLQIFERGGFPPKTNYLFLGDYVDRGSKSLETFLLPLCFKVKYPENFFMLRGNHECAAITRIYGFYDECKRRASIKYWKMFIGVFDRMPIAAVIDDRIFCIHGGLSPEVMESMNAIKSISRPTDVPERGLLCDFLWADPAFDMKGWAENDRGVSYLFGLDVVEKFLATHGFDFIVRAHQVVPDGFEFFGKRKLITVFSAPNYCGEFNNSGAVMHVDEMLCCSFSTFRPAGADPPAQGGQAGVP